MNAQTETPTNAIPDRSGIHLDRLDGKVALVTGAEQNIGQAMPVRRWGSVDDLACSAVFLCTKGRFMNGQALHLNGGEFMF